LVYIQGCSNLPDPNEPHLDSLLSNHNVVNYKLKESSFYKTALSESNAHSNIDSFKEIRNLLRLEENGQKDGIILYTSGTSGPPKGVVSTRSNVLAMTETIAHAWEVSPSDALLHVLPLNHTHGLIFALLTYVMNGAQTQMLPKFNPEEVWSRLLDLNNDINSFMAVPTIYVQLVDYFMKNAEFRKKYDEHRIKYIYIF
jgi:acyl-CoA synthetase (AMP-forming)/AMP-acid ligase II